MRRIERVVDDDGVVVSEKTHEIPAYWDEEKGYLFWVRKNCAKSFQEVPYPAAMTKLDIGHMAVLAKHIWQGTNMLGKAGRGGVRAYDVSDMAKALDITESWAYRFVERMTKLGMMAKVRISSGGQSEVQYYVNPIYWFSGNRIPLNLYLLFRVQLNAVLPGWVIRRYGNLIELQHHKK